jgi:hypothetical protein
MLEHQASNFWKRLLRCRSKQLVILWKIASFSEKSRRQHYQRTWSSHLLKKSLLEWQKNSSKRAKTKGLVLNNVVKRGKDDIRRVVLSWRRVFCDRAAAVAELRKKVVLVVMSDVVRKWLIANLKNAFVFRNFTLCSQKFMLSSQRTAFIGWITLCKATKENIMELQRETAQENLRVRRIEYRSIFCTFAAWTRFIKQQRDMSSKSQCFRELKSTFLPIKIQRQYLSIWFVATKNRLCCTSFKDAILLKGKKVFLLRKIQESMMIVFKNWKGFHVKRLRARNDLQSSRLRTIHRSFDMWVAFTCRECLISFKSNGLVQRSILVRRFSKVGTAGRSFFRWRNCALKIRRKRRFAVFVSRLFKKGEKQMLVSHFSVWYTFCKNQYEKSRTDTELKRKVIKLWRTECRICVRYHRRQLGRSFRAWIAVANERSFLQMRSSIKVMLRVLTQKNTSHLFFAIETSILKSKSSIKASAFKPFRCWAMIVEMRRHSYLQLAKLFDKWRSLVRCAAKIRSAVICSSNSFKQSVSDVLKYSVNQFFTSMTICCTKLAKDSTINRVLLFNGMFERLRSQKQRLSMNTISKKSRLNQLFEYWKSLSLRNATLKWLSLQTKMHFAVRRLRSWTRRKRLCEATNRFLNRLSRSLLSVVVAFWKRTVLIIKKRVLDISAVQNRLARNACQRLLSATVAAWKLLTVSKCKMMPVASGSQLSLSFSERRSSARRDAIWRDLNSSNHSDSP